MIEACRGGFGFGESGRCQSRCLAETKALAAAVAPCLLMWRSCLRSVTLDTCFTVQYTVYGVLWRIGGVYAVFFEVSQ